MYKCNWFSDSRELESVNSHPVYDFYDYGNDFYDYGNDFYDYGKLMANNNYYNSKCMYSNIID